MVIRSKRDKKKIRTHVVKRGNRVSKRVPATAEPKPDQEQVGENGYVCNWLNG